MLAMENASRYSRPTQGHSSVKHRRSGYEPSDTETEWQPESPWHDGLLFSNRTNTPLNTARSISPLDSGRKFASVEDYSNSSVQTSRTTPAPRRHSRSPHKPVRDSADHLSPVGHSDARRHTSPSRVQENHRHVSPYKARRDELNQENNLYQGGNQRTTSRVNNSEAHAYFPEISRVSDRSNSHHHGSVSAPKPRGREAEPHVSSSSSVRSGGRRPSPLAKAVINKGTNSSKDEINEIIANTKLSNAPTSNALLMQSTESIYGDIFFSRDCTTMPNNPAIKNGNYRTDPQKDSGTKNSSYGKNNAQQLKVVSERSTPFHQGSRGSSSFNQNPQAISFSSLFSQTNTSSTSSVGRMSGGKNSNDSGKFSDSSGKFGTGFRKFMANRQKSQSDTWFSCVRARSCGQSRSPPESRPIDEASFIQKAFVVEELRMFWADKHCPQSLSGFICHKQQAQLLKQLISHNSCPHILFKGPSGSGKKSLSMALLYEIFRDSSMRVSHELRHLHVQESSPVEIVVPVSSSPHHVELNLKSESKNGRYALMALVKEIASNHAPIAEDSDTSFKTDYKVIVLYEVDKTTENVQHLIKWVMDCYTDVCKIILCCEDDTNILDSIKNRCKLVNVDAPVTQEIIDVLIQIAKKESLDLSIKFAAKIATESKHNLRRAIMALEACKAHKYPFTDEQPIPLGWEEVLVELAAEILADPSPKRLFLVRGKLQKLLVEFVHPKLILQKLVEQFLKGIEASLKRELYYWHAYYDKRLPTGTRALLKLEEFVAKFMSIQRKSISFSSTSYA